MFKTIREHRLFWPLIVIGGILMLVGGGLGLYFFHDLVAFAKGTLETVQEMLRGTHPAVFFTAMAILPAFGFPISPLYVLSAAYGAVFSICATAIALAINLTLTYWMGVGIFRPMIEKLVSRSRFSIPKVTSEHAKLAFIVRITPGLPFFMQSYLLALSGVPFLTYLTISWVIQTGFAIAFILVGESVFEGETGMLVFGICLVAGLSVGAKMAYNRASLARKTASETAAT